jgi:hypothetical protein
VALVEIQILHHVQLQWQQQVEQQLLLLQHHVMHVLFAVTKHPENIMECIGR